MSQMAEINSSDLRAIKNALARELIVPGGSVNGVTASYKGGQPLLIVSADTPVELPCSEYRGISVEPEVRPRGQVAVAHRLVDEV
jgi:hypothetical protein